MMLPWMEREKKDLRMREAPSLRVRDSGSRGMLTCTILLRYGGCWGKGSPESF